MSSSFSQNDILPHIIELRTRVIRSSLLFVFIFSIFFYFDGLLYTYFAAPLLKQLPAGSRLIATEITSTFTVPMKLAFISTLFTTMPYLLYHLWKFISPGLYRHEQKTLFPFFLSSLFLFYLGVGFSYFVICPLALQFFVQTTPPQVAMLTDIRHYLDFVLSLLFAGGVAFQVPIVTFILIKSQLVSIQQFVHIRPYVIVGAFVLGMLLTPPDVVSQILLALPMWGLFELGLWFGGNRVLSRNNV